MSTPTVVSRPARLRLRDLLHRGGPVLMCAIAVGVILLLWQRDLLPSNFVGEVQSPANVVNSPEVGRLVDVLVQPFQMVTNGQVLGRIATRSDDSLNAEVLAMKADLEIMRARMAQDQERNDLNHAQLRSELLLHRLDLASSRIRLRQAESEFERVKLLYDQQLVSAGWGADRNGYEVALRDRDLLQAEVKEREAHVAALESDLLQARASGNTTPSVIRDSIEAALRAQEQQLRQIEGPVVLRASIDGMVTKVNHLKGEVVPAAMPIFEIHGDKPGWILGYVRQPLNSPPRVGDTVVIRSRGRPVQTAETKVLHVGSHLETFVQTLRVRGFDSSMERGLPVLLAFPGSLNLHPGELVDIVPN